MCDASGVDLRVVLRQIKDKILHSIYYASKTINEAQRNYIMTKQEFLLVAFAFKKNLLLFALHESHSAY